MRAFLASLCDLILVGAADAALLFLLALVFVRWRFPLFAAARFALAAHLLLRLALLALVALWPAHSTADRAVALLVSFAFLSETVHPTIAETVHGVGKPTAYLIAAAVVLVDSFGFSPLADWVWSRLVATGA